MKPKFKDTIMKKEVKKNSCECSQKSHIKNVEADLMNIDRKPTKCKQIQKSSCFNEKKG